MEYAGYVPSGFIDWSGIAKGLQDNIDKGLQERKKKIDEDKKLFEDAKKKLGEYQNTQSPSYNIKAYQLTSSARGYLLDLDKKLKNGEITRDEYKINTNNIYEQYDSFINTSKQFDQYVSSVNEIKNSGKASAEFMAKANANLAFMGLTDGTADLQLDGSGNIYVSKDGTPISIKQWTNLQNLANTRVDVNTEISKFTDKLAEVTRSKTLPSGASITTEDARQMKAEYDAIKANSIATVVNRNNPSTVVSILMDNSDLGYQIFMNKNMITAAVDNAVQKQEIENGEGVSLTEEQKQKIKSDIESKAILYAPSGDGELSATITDKMIADAEKVVGDYFEGQVDSKINSEAARIYRGRGDGGGGYGDDDKKEIDFTLYQKSLEAFNLPFSETSGTPERERAKELSAQRLTSLSGGRYNFAWGTGSNKGFLIATEKGKKNPKKIKAKKYDEIVPILFGESGATGSDKAYQEYKKQRKEYFSSGGQTIGGIGAGDAIFEQKE